MNFILLTPQFNFFLRITILKIIIGQPEKKKNSAPFNSVPDSEYTAVLASIFVLIPPFFVILS